MSWSMFGTNLIGSNLDSYFRSAFNINELINYLTHSTLVGYQSSEAARLMNLSHLITTIIFGIVTFWGVILSYKEKLNLAHVIPISHQPVT